MVKVYNHKYDEAPPEAVYVGRPTKWGNPFTHKKSNLVDGKNKVATASEAIELHIKHIMKEFPKLDTPEAREFFGPLIGKDLICWCAPKGGIEHTERPLVCHAQILASLAEAHGLMRIREHDGSTSPPTH